MPSVYIDVCVVPQIPLAEVNRLQSLYTVAMFRRHLLGEGEYGAFLTVEHAAQEPSAIFFPDAFSVPALTAAGLVLLGGLLAGTAARWTRRRGGVG